MGAATDRPRTVVVDAFAVSPGSSAVVVGGIVDGWAAIAPDDRVVVVSAGPLPMPIPDGVEHEVLTTGLPGPLGPLLLRLRGVRRVAERVSADAVLLGVTTGRLRRIRARRGAVVYDLRHEIMRHQFSWLRRSARGFLYGRTARTADALFCISDRTRRDLVERYPVAAGKAFVAHLGADHADDWADGWTADTSATGPYAIAFGHFANKNVDTVVDAWAEFAARRPEWTLRLVGLSGEARALLGGQLAERGITDRVEMMPWLDDDAFGACFAGASMVVFPSDFEGFGLPVVEALRRGIACVTSADAALQEVGGGFTVVVDEPGPSALAAGLAAAADLDPQVLAAGREWSRRFTWSACAQVYRDELMC